MTILLYFCVVYLDRLVAMRLVFDKGPRQPYTEPPSDLNRTLIELSRKYGLVFELETERDAVTVSSAAVDENGNGPAKCAKRNLLTAVRGKAQRLWNQRQLVFKTGDGNDDGRPDKDQGADDLESGRAGATASVQATPCTVTTVNETETAVVQQTAMPAQNVPVKYHTLEYGASAQLSPDSGVHCCTVNSPEPVAKQMEATAAQVTVDRQDDTAPATGAAVVCEEKKPKTDGEPTTVTGAAGSARHTTASNPPPPPPRKYSAQVVQSANAAAVRPDTPPAAAVVAPPDAAIAPDVAPPLPVAASSDKTAAAKHEIRMDDDYYWCTTTSMAPPMSTFGKRPSATDGPAITSTVADKARTGTVGDAAVDGGATVGDTVVLDDMDGGGIEDASLPPFSSDDDDDDDDDMDVENGVFAEKTKFECPAVVDPVNDETNASSDGRGKDKAATKGESPLRNGFGTAENGVAAALAPAPESKSPTKLPTLKLSLSSPLSSTASCCSSSSSSSSTSSASSCTSSSPTNNNNNNSPIVSKIPVRRQSSSGCGGTVPAAVSTPLTNGTPKKSIPLPLSRSGSRLAMWSSVN